MSLIVAIHFYIIHSTQCSYNFQSELLERLGLGLTIVVNPQS